MNFFNSLKFSEKVNQLGQCRFMDPAEFNGVEKLKGKKVVIVGCGAQGFHQGLNLRDSGLDITYALRDEEIAEKLLPWKLASENNFNYGKYEEVIPEGDLVLNLTPDKYHTPVVSRVVPLMKKGACLSYSHGFNIVEEGMKIREDLTVIMVAPKSPGSEVRAEYERGFGVPTLIAVHTENDPNGDGLEIAKAYAAGTGGNRAGVLLSSFVAEVKSDLMGEQTILCGMLQTGSLLSYDKMIEKGIDSGYAAKLIQMGWETVTEALKQGGITNMMDRLTNAAKVKAFELSEELKTIMRPLYQKHMDDILEADFSETMMKDWADNDKQLFGWREDTGKSAFETAELTTNDIPEQEYFDNGILMIAMVKAGVELAYEIMTEAGMKGESAYYESLHETPLIANTIARNKLYEMNVVISDTAEYGNYLFTHACVPLLKDFMTKIDTDVIGKGMAGADNTVDNKKLIDINDAIRNHPVEVIGKKLRGYMTSMKSI